MQKIFVALTLLLLSVTGRAQDSISRYQILAFPYMNAHTGVSYGVLGQRHLGGRWYINGGIKFHQNTVIPPKLNRERFYHRFYAPKPLKHFGLAVGLKYELPFKNKLVRPYVYYDLAFFHMNTRTQYVNDRQTINTIALIPLVNSGFTNLTSLENGLGMGLKAKLTGKLFLNTRAGLGTNFIFNLPARYSGGMHVDYAVQYAIGMEYAF